MQFSSLSPEQVIVTAIDKLARGDVDGTSSLLQRYVEIQANNERIRDAGKSLRDLFAGKAMQALIAADNTRNPCEDRMSEDHVAAIAYTFADAMLKERQSPRVTHT